MNNIQEKKEEYIWRKLFIKLYLKKLYKIYEEIPVDNFW